MTSFGETGIPSEISCYHCGLSAPLPSRYQFTRHQQTYDYCCMGCQSASKTIFDLGLSDYYRFRDASLIPNPVGASTLQEHALKTQLKKYDHPEEQKWINQPDGQGGHTTTILIQGMQCAACGWLIEQSLKSLKGILSVRFNLTLKRVIVHWQESDILLSDILWRITTLGYIATPFQASEQSKVREAEMRLSLKRVWIASLGMMQVMMFAVGLYFGAFEGIEKEYALFFRWLSLLLTTPVVIYVGYPIFKAAYQQLKQKQVSMNFSVSLAVILAFFASTWSTLTDSGDVYFDSVTMFLFFVTLSKHLEKKLQSRAIESYEQLSHSFPKTIERIKENTTEVIGLHQACLQDIIRVKPGEMIPIDGIVVKGKSNVATAMVTGEFSAQKIKTGDIVYAGSQNYDGVLDIEIQKLGAETRYANIITILSQAMAEKPQHVLWIDRISKHFILGVLAFSVITYVSWLQVDAQQAFLAMLSVLVASCPCALSIATPTALTAGGFALAEKGFLVTAADALERLTRIHTALFDKTGTLTYGTYQCIDCHLLPIENPSIDTHQAYSLAASLEQYSEHPIAEAFKEKPEEWIAFDSVENITHQGLVGYTASHIYRIGSLAFAAQNSSINQNPSITQNSSEIPTRPHSTIFVATSAATKIVYLSRDFHLIAAFVLEDQTRIDAKKTIRGLQQQQIQTIILSGDIHENAERIGKELGVDQVRAELSPEHKLAELSQYKKEGKITLYIGDGVNDAPTLSAAHISIAMGSGTDLAKTNADCILLHNRLETILVAIEHAKCTQKVIRQNLTWALVYNIAVLPIAAAGFLPPYLAALGMSLSSLIVIFNALKLSKI